MSSLTVPQLWAPPPSRFSVAFTPLLYQDTMDHGEKLSNIPYQRTIGPENAHLKPDLGVLSHNEMTLTLNTHTPLLTS